MKKNTKFFIEHILGSTQNVSYPPLGHSKIFFTVTLSMVVVNKILSQHTTNKVFLQKKIT